jgi:hypothetical protein
MTIIDMNFIKIENHCAEVIFNSLVPLFTKMIFSEILATHIDESWTGHFQLGLTKINNDIQNITQKTKDQAIQTSQKIGVNQVPWGVEQFLLNMWYPSC